MEKKTISLIGVPLDLGAGCRGVDMGPSAIRRAGIAMRLGRLGYVVEDAGNIEAPLAETLSGPGEPNARYLKEVVGVLEHLARDVRPSPGRGQASGGAWRRSFHRPRHRFRDDRMCAPKRGLPDGTAARALVGRRSHGCEHPGNLSHRQPARDAVGRPAGSWSGSAHPGGRLCCRRQADRAGECRADWCPKRRSGRGRRGRGPGDTGVYDGGGGSPGLRDGGGTRRSPEHSTEPTECTSAWTWTDSIRRVAPGVGTPVAGWAQLPRGALPDGSGRGKRRTPVARGWWRVNPIRDIRNQTAELAVELVASALGKRTLPRVGRS